MKSETVLSSTSFPAKKYLMSLRSPLEHDHCTSSLGELLDTLAAYPAETSRSMQFRRLPPFLKYSTVPTNIRPFPFAAIGRRAMRDPLGGQGSHPDARPPIATGEPSRARLPRHSLERHLHQFACRAVDRRPVIGETDGLRRMGQTGNIRPKRPRIAVPVNVRFRGRVPVCQTLA